MRKVRKPKPRKQRTIPENQRRRLPKQGVGFIVDDSSGTVFVNCRVEGHGIGILQRGSDGGQISGFRYVGSGLAVRNEDCKDLTVEDVTRSDAEPSESNEEDG